MTLTPRELDILRLLAPLDGKTNRQIAAELKLATGTVKVYISRMFDKTGANNRMQLAVWASKRVGG